MGAGQQGVVWAVRPGVVGGVAGRLRLRSELRPSLRLRRPATPLEYRCQGDISISVTVYSPATNIACSQPNCEPLLNRKRRKDNGLLLNVRWSTAAYKCAGLLFPAG